MQYTKAITPLALLLCLGCAAKRPDPASLHGLVSPSTDTRATIRVGGLDLRAKDLESIKNQVDLIVGEAGGWVAQWSLDEKWLRMTLRVLEPQLDATMDEIAALGKVVSRRLRVRDVTDELIDLEARLKNLRSLRDRLRAYLDEATNLTEILAVETELARVQTEIETIEAKLERIRSQVDVSRLDLSVKKKRW